MPSSSKLAAAQPTSYQESESASHRPSPMRQPIADTEYLAGDVVADRYRLVRKLGEGGMGVVWVAHSLVLGVDIALKLIRASAAGPGVASRMAREAQAAARLGHPALVRVFDFGWTTRGDPFLVMELAQGETLSSLLRRETRIGAIRAVQVLLPIADGLRCAHEKSIVHRDVKPENVFIAADAFGRLQPKLLDFGIAKVDQPLGDRRLTQIGAVLGSPEYMSPEQARGDQSIDERTDVWSMCVMLYEMITGQLPFHHSNYNALMQAILNDEPLPTTEHSAGDLELWKVIRQGLEKSVDDRWGSMTDLGEALALWLYEHGVKEDVSGNSVRALWLDGALSGVRPEISTGAPASTGIATKSLPPESLRVGDAWIPVRRRAQRVRRWLKNKAAAIMFIGLGTAAGIGVTLLVSSGGSETPNQTAAAESPLAPSPQAAPNPGSAQPLPPPSPTHPSAEHSPALAASATAPSAPTGDAGRVQHTTSGAARPPTRGAPTPNRAVAQPKRRAKGSINDFGF